MYRGDIRLGDTIDFKFTTVQSTGAPITLAGTPSLSAYPGNSVTQITAGITLSVDFDGVTGLHNVRIVATSGNGYATATNYEVTIAAGTINGVSAVGYVVGAFSIENRSALMPTTAAQTLDVSATGEAGVDWANVGGKTTSNALTNTTIAVTQKVDVDTIKTNPVVNGGTITFPTTATLASTTNITAGTVTTATNVTNVNGIANNVITAASINADAITAAKIADGAIDRATFAADTGLQPIRSNTAQAGAGTTITLDASASAVDSFYNNTLILLTGGTGVGQGRFISAYVGATKVATVATWATNPDNTTTFAILPFDAVAGASAPTAAQVATAVWQDLLAGSDFGTAASIGKLLKDDVDAAISTRASQTSVDTVDDFLDTEIAAIKTQTDKLTFTVANQIDANVLDWKSATAPAMTGDAFARLGAPAGASVSADVAAVKAQTAAIETDTTEIGAAGAGLTALASQTSVNTIDDFLDTEIAAIKAKTDQLVFTTANQVDARVLTNSDKTGYSVASGGIGSGAHAAAELNAIADAHLDRNMATGTDSGADNTTTRTVRQALRRLRNKESIAAGVLTVTKENDTTASWTAAVATTAGDPLSSIDPT